MPLSPSTKNLPRSSSRNLDLEADEADAPGEDDESSGPASSVEEGLRERLEALIGPELASAIVNKGFERLTPVQEAVLDPKLAGRDLRVSSQTGSGKTVAIGLAVRDVLVDDDGEEGEEEEGADGNAKGVDQRAHPRALVVVPTRELAKQVHEELAWLYAPLRLRIASVTGGGGYRDELRSFRLKPAIVVGTPGRLLDHLKRGSVQGDEIKAIVLDEADRMLDLGFREDIEAIFEHAPEEHRTHLVSATFPREVKALADRLQTNPVPVEGTPLGTANLDIEHLVHLVNPRERLAAIINLLLDDPRITPPAEASTNPDDASPDGDDGMPIERSRPQSLVFARTRADVADLAEALTEAGFSIAMLSGEMEQPERQRALAAFKRGNVDALVATDVAARGIDVQDVARVIHASPPDDPDAYTHRSGRTGRAGKKGTSSVVITLSELPRVSSLLTRARVRFRFAPVPSAESIREARDTTMLAQLTTSFVEGEAVDSRSLTLAERILASTEPARAVARLVALAKRSTQVEPRDVMVISPPQPKAPGAARRQETRFGRDDRERGGYDRDRGRDRDRDHRAPREDRGAPPPHRERPANKGDAGPQRWVSFRISWGESHGADARRLVAMMCRRGQIEGRDIGAIRVGRTSSVIDVSEGVAADFERSASKPDPRDPRVHVRRWVDEPPARGGANFGGPRRERDQDREAREPARDRDHVREAPAERPSRRAMPKEASESSRAVADVPPERPSRRAVTKEAPPERPSRRAVAKEAPPDRPSRRAVAKEAPPERPSRRAVAKETPPDRPSRRAVAKEAPPAAAAPSRRVVKDAPAKKKPWQKKRPKWQGDGGAGGGGHRPPKRRH